MATGALLVWPGNLNAVHAPEQGVDVWFWMLRLYAAGALVMAGRFILQVFSLWQLHRQSAPAKHEGVAYREMAEPINPYSFWRAIYIQSSAHSEQQLKALLLHEQVHCSQWHTLDILLGQLFRIAFWFNPLAWLMQHEIRQNLEYLADEQVLAQGLDAKSYQYSLVHLGQAAPGSSNLTSRFNLNPIKDRIMMMNKQKTNPVHKFKYLLLPPAIMLVALLTTTSKAEVAAQSVSQGLLTSPHDTTKAGLHGTDKSGNIFFIDGIRADEAQAEQIDPSEIEKIDMLGAANASHLIGDENVKRITLITTKAGKDSEAVRALKTKLDAVYEKGNSLKVSMIKGKDDSSAKSQSDSAKLLEAKEPIYILDGNKVSTKVMQSLDPNTIASVNVLKGEKATAEYGKDGESGVVVIKTKQKSDK
ncbi:M56 family metallopeptidase [Pontibacter oryzae]|uniref:M56 family peptidase n=1 Tax=Pontibacter oryzae TaxID=2304593 RepID=A0A399SHF3_9BACT|nr:M56 family metallopeptidase [Pontibacter oryzae]RIJ41943.1 M56 family peptidase [Pontibacter oryzae]